MTEAATPFSGSPYRTAAHVVPDSDALVVPYDGQERMRLSIATGISSARVHVDRSATALVGVDAGAVLAPRLRASADEVRLSFEQSFAEWMRALFSGQHHLDIALHPAVAWELSVRGGASSLELDLSRGRLARMDVRGGCSDVDMVLPAPMGLVPIRISGGASHVRLQRPAEATVRVSVSGGISSLRLDDRSFSAMGGAVRLGTGDASSDAPAYEVHVRGGASDIEVEKS